MDRIHERRTQLLAIAFGLAMLTTAFSLWLLRRNILGRRKEARLRLIAERSTDIAAVPKPQSG